MFGSEQIQFYVARKMSGYERIRAVMKDKGLGSLIEGSVQRAGSTPGSSPARSAITIQVNQGNL